MLGLLVAYHHQCSSARDSPPGRTERDSLGSRPNHGKSPDLHGCSGTAQHALNPTGLKVSSGTPSDHWLQTFGPFGAKRAGPSLSFVSSSPLSKAAESLLAYAYSSSLCSSLLLRSPEPNTRRLTSLQISGLPQVNFTPLGGQPRAKWVVNLEPNGWSTSHPIEQSMFLV